VKITGWLWISGNRRLAVAPEEVIVDLTSADEILQLFETGETAPIEDIRCHLDLFEEIVQLPRAAPGIPPAPESR
jgi:hypothetical protein